LRAVVDLYDEAIARSFNPSMPADAMVGQAAVARRPGDLARALLDAAGTYYRNVGLPAGQTGVLAAGHGGHSARAKQTTR
jgi:uncharacterized membrane protein